MAVYILFSDKNAPRGNFFGQHTAAQISASTRRRRFRPAHGDTDAAPKILREKNLRAEGPQIFFETVSVEQGFMTKKVCFMTEKVFVLMQPVLHMGVTRNDVDPSE